ncbi:MAG TPA: RidA family protein, partial [Vicinamibacterales bacterium]|nr:RidA family protein [Vicinamibacterales bacterium]
VLLSVVAMSFAAVTMSAQSSTRQVFPGANPAMPFSAAVKADGLIYVSGTLGSNGDIKAQTKQVLDNIAATLKTAGSSLANAASVTVYLKNQSDFAAMNEVYRSYWTKDPPARTTVMLPLLNEGLVEIAVVAIPDGGERLVVNPSEWSSSPNPYSYAIRTGNTLFLSGLIARNGKDNTPIKGDMAAQTKAVLENGAAVLKAAGFAYSDVVASRVYLSDQAAFADMNKVYQSYFPTDPPARATVKTLLTSADYIVEITMVAVKGGEHTAFTTPTPDGKPGTKNPNLSSAIKAGNRLYVAGILGNTIENKGDIQAQTAEALQRIARTLKAAGYDWKDVVEGVVYLPDLTKFNDMNAAYRPVFGKDFPARATVGAGLMNADAAVEIMLTAVK